MSEQFTAILPSPQYIELKFVDGGLAARYDPVRGVLEVQRRGMKHYFDLAQLKETVKKTVDNSPELCYDGDRNVAMR